MRKKADVTSFKSLSHHLPGATDGNQDQPQSVFRTKIEPGTCQIISRIPNRSWLSMTVQQRLSHGIPRFGVLAY